MITLIGPLAIHMYIPLMPTIQQAFGVSTATTTLTFSLVMFVVAFGTLIYGNASDYFGRRPVILTGLAVFVAGSVVCAAADDFAVLLTGRLLQAIAAGCGVVLARAIARDVYGPKKLAQVISYLTAAYVLGPTLAPPLGGAVSDMFGWNAVFVMSVGLSVLILLLAALLIRETHMAGREYRSLRSIFADFGRLMKNMTFLCYALIPACTSSSFFALSVYSSFLMLDHYRGTPGEYGLYFMLLTLGFMAGNIVSGRLGSRVQSRHMVLVGCVTGFLAFAITAASTLLLPDLPLALFLPGALIGISQGVSLPHCHAMAINVEPELTGTSSGAVMFLHFLSAAIASQVVAQIYNGTFYPMLEVVGGLMLVALILGWYANLRLRRLESV